MLENRLTLVLLNTFRHHIKQIMHHGSTELKVKVRFNTLLRNRLAPCASITTLKLTS